MNAAEHLKNRFFDSEARLTIEKGPRFSCIKDNEVSL